MKQHFVLLIGLIFALFLASSVSVFSTYPSGMISYWRLDDGAGTGAIDSVGANLGTVHNGAAWTTGKANGALRFDGVDDYVEVADSANLAITDAITLEAWIYPTAFVSPFANTILTKGIPRSYYGDYELGYYGNASSDSLYPGSKTDHRFFLRLNGNAKGIWSISQVPLNTWTHVIATYDRVTMKMYVNGQLDNTLSYSTRITTSRGSLRLGATLLLSPNQMRGVIDEVAIYNRALTLEEIRQHYQNGLAGFGYSGPTTVTLASSSFFGGSGEQFGTGISIRGGAIYVSGGASQWTGAGGDSAVARYTVPPASSPTWSSYLTGSGTRLRAIASTDEGVYAAAESYTLTSDTIGDKETKSILVKFSPSGGSPLWVTGAPLVGGKPGPFFTAYSGFEFFNGVTTASLGGSTFIFATGEGQPGFYSRALILVKYDASGNLLKKATDSTLGIRFDQYYGAVGVSRGSAVTVFNGNIYSAGSSSLEEPSPETYRPVLWKHDPDLNIIWRKRATETGFLNGVTASGGYIYAVGNTYTLGVASSEDFLVQKYDEAGNRIWSKVSGGSREDVLTGVVAVGSRLFAVGYTKSQGAGGADAVVLEIDPATGNTLSTTLFGGAQDDMARGVATDEIDLYVVGESKSFAQGGNAVGQNDLVLLRYTSGPRDVTVTQTVTVAVTTTQPVTQTVTTTVSTKVVQTDTFTTTLTQRFTTTVTQPVTRTFTTTIERFVTAQESVFITPDNAFIAALGMIIFSVAAALLIRRRS